MKALGNNRSSYGRILDFESGQHIQSHDTVKQFLTGKTITVMGYSYSIYIAPYDFFLLFKTLNLVLRRPIFLQLGHSGKNKGLN